MARRAALAMAALVLGLLVGSAEGGGKIEARLKPLLDAAAKSLSGWTYVKGTYVFCPTPKSLTKIYDGGYEAYTKRGAVAAASAVFQRRSPRGIITVIVHYTKGPAQSKALYTWLQKQTGKGKRAKCFSVDKKAFGCVLPIPGGHAGYGYYGTIMVSVNATGERTEADVLRALRAVLGKAVPKRKGKRG